MKKIASLLVGLLTLVSCNERETRVAGKTTVPQEEQKDKPDFRISFEEFRRALAQKDRSKLKSYFSFPVMNENNEIWYAINEEANYTDGVIKPFTESDFDLGCFKLFDSNFAKSIMAIKTKPLFETGNYETPYISEGNLRYRTTATYDSKNKEVTLNFYTEEKIEIDKGEYEKSEFSRIYYFDILPNNKLQFKKIRLAG
ncbi:hypothetical protein [Flavobacterium sp.]